MKKAGISIMLCIALIGAFCLGQMTQPEKSYAVGGSLIMAQSSWYGGAENASVTVGLDGTYLMEVSGGKGYSGQTGGKLSGYINLKKGDIVKTVVYNGGYRTSNSADTNYQGGKAIAIEVNDVRVIGAGGAGGSGSTTMSFQIGESVSSINNAKFGAGGGGGHTTSNGTDGLPSGTSGIGGGTSAPGKAGCNFIDTGKMALAKHSNGSTEVSFRVSYDIAATNANITGEVGGLNTRLDSLTTAVSSLTTKVNGEVTKTTNLGANLTKVLNNTNSLLSATDVPEITVIAGKEFDKLIAAYPDMDSGSAQGVSVENNVKTDKTIRLYGKIDVPGDVEVVINSKSFLIHVVS